MVIRMIKGQAYGDAASQSIIAKSIKNSIRRAPREPPGAIIQFPRKDRKSKVGKLPMGHE